MSKIKIVAMIDLFRLQDKLDCMLIYGDISLIDYWCAWDDLLVFANCTQADFIRELDRNWTSCDRSLN